MRTVQAVLYTRVSSRDQEREGFSIPAQQKLLRAYARAQQLTVVREFTDVETAKAAGRGGFGEMLAFLKTHPTCRTVLVEKTDRLYRNIKDWITVDDFDLAVHFVKEGAVISKDSRSSEKFLHGIKVLMAKNYVDNLSEEVRKGLKEKAEQGHWPSVAPVGYVNNRTTHRIEVDPVRGPLVTRVFELYAQGGCSLKALAQRAYEMGLRHWRGDRRLTTSEIHRMLRALIYTGDFLWLGRRYSGSHTPLVSMETFQAVQAQLGGKPRPRKARHAFMGLVTCGRCGCAMTAEMKKGRYVYYRCTGFRGRCENTYIRQERLAELLGATMHAIQIPEAVAEQIAASLRDDDGRVAERQAQARQQLEERRRKVLAKLDRSYEDYLEGRITEDFWHRKSEDWESERRTVEAELERLQHGDGRLSVTAGRILELAKRAVSTYETQDPGEQRRLLETVLSNCTFDRGTLCPTYTSPFDLFAKGNETGDWRRERDSVAATLQIL